MMPDGGEGEDRRFPQWLGVVLIVVFLPIVLLFLITFLAYGLLLHVLVWLWWLPRGKSILVVTSESPVWAQYMEDRIVTVLRRQAVVLNWSERSLWRRIPTIDVMVFHYFGRGSEFNPMVVVFRPLRPAKAFRFWKPFREFKHGKPEAVEALTERVLRYAIGHNVRAA